MTPSPKTLSQAIYSKRSARPFFKNWRELIGFYRGCIIPNPYECDDSRGEIDAEIIELNKIKSVNLADRFPNDRKYGFKTRRFQF